MKTTNPGRGPAYPFDVEREFAGDAPTTRAKHWVAASNPAEAASIHGQIGRGFSGDNCHV